MTEAKTSLRSSQEQTRILIIDDNRDFAANMGEISQMQGFLPTLAYSVEEARRALREQEFAVATVDQRLPDGSGTELIREMRLSSPDIVAVLVTDFPSVTNSVAAMNEGAFAFVSKDTNADEIASILGRAAENARLRLENRQLRSTQEAILESISDCLLLVDDSMILRSANRRDALFCTMDPTEAVYRPLLTVLSDQVSQLIDWAELIRTAHQKATAEEDTLTLSNSETGLRCFTVRAAPVPGAQDPWTLLHIIDLTERIELERRLSESENLAALGRLASTIAHEIRNPVAGIRALTQILEKHSPKDGSDRENLIEILHLTDRIHSTLSDLLSFARPLPAAEEPIDLHAMLKGLIRDAERLPSMSGRSFNLACLPGADHCVIHGQRNSLLGALENLVENALHAAPVHGVVQLTLECDETECRIFVEDSGPGIAEEDMSRLFQPFFTRKVRGTGLGLAIAKKAIQSHGGTIQVGRSKTLRGASFCVRLPIHSSSLSRVIPKSP